MVFGFGKKKDNNTSNRADKDDEIDDGEDVELVNFQGAVNGKPVDMAANSRLAQAALVPTKEMITDGLERRAEMIRLDVKGERAQTTVSVDGMPYAGSKMPKQQALAITQMVKLLAVASGSRGMAGGQAIDLAATGQSLTLPELEFMHICKTGAIIRAAT